MYFKNPKIAFGISLASLKSMTKAPYRQILLVVGILVALIVILIINSAILTDQSSVVENPINKINELSHYSIPNLIFHLY